MTTQHQTITLRVVGKPQHAIKIIEHIINPAFKDHGCTVRWPDQGDPEIAIDYDADELREMFKAK